MKIILKYVPGGPHVVMDVENRRAWIGAPDGWMTDPKLNSIRKFALPATYADTLYQIYGRRTEEITDSWENFLSGPAGDVHLVRTICQVIDSLNEARTRTNREGIR